MTRPCRLLPGIAAVAIAAIAAAPAPADTPEIAKAKYLWSRSPHGKMLERILPPSIEPAELPEPRSEGARLAARYCVQCHYLPNPQMHTAAKWKPIVDRMVWRMRGHGNLGEVMKEMMVDVKAPTEAEVISLARYLEQHGQAELDPTHPGLKSEAGQIYSIACSQCHALPDPRRHTALEWPRVVNRMKGHMAWTNTIIGARESRTIPELKTAEIVRFLQRYARPDGKAVTK
ncbi:MAG: hypothetical protein OEZ08_09795 [Betaproteobacteria bacterium]|nr:hypothetical protein [Betaproteobacteria bacterium]